MAVTYTLTQVGKTNIVGNRKQKVYDLTSDTGTYVTGGNSLTASQFGLKKFDFVLVGSVATGGTSGATANPLGVIYNSTNTSITLQQYEAATAGTPDGEKTNAEAVVANFAVRLFVQGY